MNWRAVLISAMLAIAPLCTTSATAVGAPWGRDYLPNSPVVSQDNKPLSFYDDVLKGKITIISFIYTTCRDICPVVTARLSQLEEKLGSIVGRDVFFVSISIDPENDTPEKMKQYADAFSAGPSWLFLTGTSKDMETIRYKLGERSDKISAHRNEILLYNDNNGVWERASVFGDLNTLSEAVRAMDPAWRSEAVSKPNPASGKSATAASTTGPDPAMGLPGEALFIRVCASCHTIGHGAKVGPDLAYLTSRRERAWISSYIADPNTIRVQNTPIVRELMERFPTVRMPNLGLADVDVSDVVAYIEAMTYATDADKKSAEAQHVHSHHHHH